MHTTALGNIMSPPTTEEARKQEPLSCVAPMWKTALLMGAGGGFVLATMLILACASSVPLGV